MRLLITILAIIIGLLYSFRKPTNSYFKVPKNWPKPSYNFKANSLNDNTIELGRALFYDPNLSDDGSISCASCHSSYNAFTHVDHDLSHGIEDRIGTRNSPALMNLAWKKSFMWDGAIHNLDVQALAPISHPDEMGSSIAEVVRKLNHSTRYKKAFYKSFGDSLITGEKTLKAMSQFMLTLISANTKYDRVKKGKEKFTEQEEKGYQLFLKNCASCHKEPLFTTDEFANNGLALDKTLNDLGRFKISQKAEDSLKFKIPTLRNIEFSFPYMHDGRFKTLKEVINHYEKGIIHYTNLDTRVKKSISFTSNDKVDLTAFLLTLSDKEFLFNPKFSYPKDFFSN